MDDDSPNKKKWYPGKYLKTAVNKRQSAHGKHSVDGETNSLSQLTSRPSELGDYSYEEESNYSNSFSEPNPIVESQVDNNTGSTEINAVNEAKETTFSEGSTKKSSSSSRGKRYGKVILYLDEIRYLALAPRSTKVIIEVEGSGTSFTISDDKFPLVKEFEFSDITSDIRIEFRGIHSQSGTPAQAMVMIPLVNALTLFGKPVATPKKWYVIYPYYDKNLISADSLSNLPTPKAKQYKWRSAYSDVPGSALTKPLSPLGFVFASISLELYEGRKNALGLYLVSPSGKQPNQTEDNEITSANMTELSMQLSQAKFNRDFERIKNILFKAPACISPLLSFPEIFALVLVFSFFTFSLSRHQVPLAIFFVLLLNGVVAKMNRKINVTLWNEPGVSLNIVPNLLEDSPSAESRSKSTAGNTNAIFANLPTIIAILSNSKSLQLKVSTFAHNLEVYSNLFTFADGRVSAIVYGVLFGFSVFLTIWLCLFSVASLVAIGGSLIFLVMASTEFVPDQISQLSSKSLYWKYINAFNLYYELFQNLLAKTPDQLELNHRSVCDSASNIKEGGAEMLDAAASLNTPAK